MGTKLNKQMIYFAQFLIFKYFMGAENICFWKLSEQI